MSSPLKIISLVKDYAKIRAVDDVTFEVQPGEVFGLLGPNGAGKTTIISTITTLEKPTEGRVEVFGVDVTKEPKKAKSFFGVVPQEIVHQGFFSIREILQIYSGFHGIMNNEEQIDFLLEKLDLNQYSGRMVKQLSGGMKRRLMIAKALVHKPKLLLLDEPTAGVDIELRHSLWEFVEELRREGITILLTTHYLEEAEKLCDRVGIIHKGKFVKIGPTKDLVRELTDRQIRLELKDGSIQTYAIPSQQKIGDFFLKHNVMVDKISDIQIEEGSLEQAFQRLISHE